MALFGGRSTYTNLLEAYSDGILILQDRNVVSAAHIDFSKAFDSVSHQNLFTRLYSHGIRTTSYSGYKTFFSGRTYQTRVGHSISVLLSYVQPRFCVLKVSY